MKSSKSMTVQQKLAHKRSKVGQTLKSLENMRAVILSQLFIQTISKRNATEASNSLLQGLDELDDDAALLNKIKSTLSNSIIEGEASFDNVKDYSESLWAGVLKSVRTTAKKLDAVSSEDSEKRKKKKEKERQEDESSTTTQAPKVICEHFKMYEEYLKNANRVFLDLHRQGLELSKSKKENENKEWYFSVGMYISRTLAIVTTLGSFYLMLRNPASSSSSNFLHGLSMRAFNSNLFQMGFTSAMGAMFYVTSVFWMIPLSIITLSSGLDDIFKELRDQVSEDQIEQIKDHRKTLKRDINDYWKNVKECKDAFKNSLTKPQKAAIEDMVTTVEEMKSELIAPAAEANELRSKFKQQ